MPVLQISENRHKKDLCTSPRHTRVRGSTPFETKVTCRGIYFRSEELCAEALVRMREVLEEMQKAAEEAHSLVEAYKAGVLHLSENEHQKAFQDLQLEAGQEAKS